MKKQDVARVGSALPVCAAIATGCLAVCCIAACGGATTANGGFTAGSPQGNGVLSTGHAYIASRNTQGSGAAGAIYQYTIAADGSLSPLEVPSVPTGVDPESIVADPTEHFVYTANSGDGTLSGYAIGTDGTLTPLADDVNVSFSASGALVIDPTGAHAYLVGTVPTPGCTVCGSDDELVQFAIGPAGALSESAPVPAGSGEFVHVVIAPSGRGAYISSDCMDDNCDGSIAPYAIPDTGQLSAAGAATLTGPHVEPVDLVIDGSGSTAYLIADLMGVDTIFGTLYQYTISDTGTLSELPASFPLHGSAVAESRYGPDLYVLSGPAGLDAPGTVANIGIYSIGSDGQLTNVSTTQIAASSPTGMVLIATP